MDDELKKIISNLIKEKGGSHEDYRLLMDKIAFHESKLDPRARQLGGGPGRGKYQFEEGRFKGAKTAANRALNYYKKNNLSIPNWLKNLKSKESVDATKLSSKQQDILFLTNMLEHPKADLGKVIKGEEPIEDFWANYHWSGDSKDRSKRIESFNNSLSEFEKRPVINTENKSLDLQGLFRDIAKDNTQVNLPRPNIDPNMIKPIGLNQFNNGGLIDPPNKKSSNNSLENTSIPEYVDPIGSAMKDAAIANTKDPEYPKTFTKTKSIFSTTGLDHPLLDRRNQFLKDSYITKTGKEVDFNKAVNSQGGQMFLNRYNDPITRQRLKEQAGLTDKDIDNMILQGLHPKVNIGDHVPGSKGTFYHKDPDNIYMNPDYKDNLSTETHERLHASNIDAAMGKPLLDVLGNPFQQKTRSFLKRVSPETLRYLNRPHEAYGNFAEFRENLGLKPGEQVDIKRLKKLVKEKGLGNENFFRAWDDDKIVKALNTIAYQSNNKNNDIA